MSSIEMLKNADAGYKPIALFADWQSSFNDDSISRSDIVTSITPSAEPSPMRKRAINTGRIQAVIATQSFPANRRILPPVSATRASCGDDR